MFTFASRTAGIALAALAALPAGAAADGSLSCDHGIVQVGDTRLDLLAKCGEPALREVFEREAGAVVVQARPPLAHGTSLVTAERWTYNFGPQRFTQLIRLEGGKIVSIERGSYGYDPATLAARKPGRASCEPSALAIGDRKLDLLAKCGEPFSVDRRTEQRAVSGPTGVAGFRAVDVEVWTYDFGPQRFVQLATLEDGVVVAIERGSYGYAQQ